MQCFKQYLSSLNVDFPTTIDLATNARNCYIRSFGVKTSVILAHPDIQLLNWLDAEYQLFKTIENNRYNERIKTPFSTVEELVECANTILNRRKSRAGKSLEHHLSEIFSSFHLNYQTQIITEENKRPDFVFPNSEGYHNTKYSSDER